VDEGIEEQGDFLQVPPGRAAQMRAELVHQSGQEAVLRVVLRQTAHAPRQTVPQRKRPLV
jgi:hypothetical protein